jgi:hypothetical protein
MGEKKSKLILIAILILIVVIALIQNRGMAHFSFSLLEIKYFPVIIDSPFASDWFCPGLSGRPSWPVTVG